MDTYKIKRGLVDPLYGVSFLLKKLSKYIGNDKLYLSLRWFTINHRFVNWNNPTTFTEKLQWMKVYYRRPELTKLVDKIEVKKYVSGIIGDQHIIPTIGVWDSADDIDFEKLPSQFVLKCNHDSGTGMCICRNKSKLNQRKVKEELNLGLHSDYYRVSREWPYKNVKRKVFAEKYMSQGDSNDLTDYKWFCFNGEPIYCQVIKDRSKCETIDFFDIKWNHQSFIGLNPRAVHANICPPQPQNLDLMIEIAKKLSKGHPFSRIDLYEINGDVYFGEITFFPMSGFGSFIPYYMDLELGKLINLPEEKYV